MADTPVHFFDVESKLPDNTKAWSFNTNKTRLVLNYKNIPYTQSFISYPEITPLLRSLQVTSYPEGPFAYTLPAIYHPPSIRVASGAMMDSLPIALHLDRLYPERPLWPNGDASYALSLAVGKLVSNAALKSLVLVIPHVPKILDKKGREYFIKTRSAMFGKPLSELRPSDPDSLRMTTESIKREVETLAQMLRGRYGKSGPFFEGENASYADFILMAYLAWTEKLDNQLWRELMGIGRGEIKALWDACLPWLYGQGQTTKWKISK
ncbi:hypothetical protein SI65_09386 [Aspergillus cristatus]|uniref:Uncharacterized protein n=1 Tax=Aspergillus cristatus TaxID=573508 RepID=A0A1E3B2J2_ASPCR|nr:hypothetical protein SI65_09386 [Aspergillus cristatus]